LLARFPRSQSSQPDRLRGDQGPLRYCGRSHRTGVLGGHLVWLAVWGVIGPDTVDHLLRRYVQRAPSTARREALEDIGRALHQTTDPIEPDVIQRLRQLWEWSAQAARLYRPGSLRLVVQQRGVRRLLVPGSQSSTRRWSRRGVSLTGIIPSQRNLRISLGQLRTGSQVAWSGSWMRTKDIAWTAAVVRSGPHSPGWPRARRALVPEPWPPVL
jgi:hypothetical protein